MKKIMIIIALAGIISACQTEQAPKQYFTEAPEIDLVKKGINAYLKQDYDILKSGYSDTARIWHNIPIDTDPGLTVDERIDQLKNTLSAYSEYDFHDQLYEMIITKEGHKWVLFWGKWKGKLNGSDQEIVVPVHMASRVIDGKVVFESAFYNTLPGYLAQQALQEADEETEAEE